MSHRRLIGLIVALVSVLLPAAAAPPASAPVEISIISVVPGTLSGPGHWCVGGVAGDEILMTAHVVDVASQSELTDGWIEWQICESSRGGFPKESCDDGTGGPVRWRGATHQDLAIDSTPTLRTGQRFSVLGWRLQYRLNFPGPVYKGATSESFNLDRTCSP